MILEFGKELSARLVNPSYVPNIVTDAQIESALGFKVEIQQGLIKCWDVDCAAMPATEFNWTPGINYHHDALYPLTALERKGVQAFLLKDDDGLDFCAFEWKGELCVTPAFGTEGAAAACALHFVLGDKS
jgi:hypothetical protein